MLQSPPAVPGMLEDEIDTPALLIDLDAFEANLDTMAARLAGTGTRLRAHAKTHKSPVVAHQQIARGAIGQCVQKVSEAEILAWGGVRDILVSNEVVGAAKLARLAALARIATISVCVDDPGQVTALEAAAAAADVTLGVLVEIGAVRRRARAGCGGLGATDRRLAASAVRRPAGVSRERPASSPACRAALRHSRGGGCDAAHGRAVASARPRMRDRGRCGDRDVRAGGDVRRLH